MAFCSSCSYLTGLHGLGSIYQKKNKGKEKSLVLEVSLRNDTLYANENANLEMTANLTLHSRRESLIALTKHKPQPSSISPELSKRAR